MGLLLLLQPNDEHLFFFFHCRLDCTMYCMMKSETLQLAYLTAVLCYHTYKLNN